MAQIHINVWLSNKRQMIYSFIKNIESMGIDIFTKENEDVQSRDNTMKAVAHINQAIHHAKKANEFLEKAKVMAKTESKSRGIEGRTDV